MQCDIVFFLRKALFSHLVAKADIAIAILTNIYFHVHLEFSQPNFEILDVYVLLTFLCG